MKEENLKKILCLKFSPGIGNVRGRKILEGREKNPDFSPAVMEKSEKEMEKITKKGISVVTLLDENYPPLLKEIYDPPLLLYYQGNLQTDFPLGVVGTRHPSRYGKAACEILARDLAEAGAEIISGFAYGIDATAHRVALKQKGRTLAVLACGLDVNYPASHYQMKREIVERGGCILSELPLGERSSAYNFPSRNRIISGLSLGVLVVEAKIESGSLITARAALEQGRTVYTIPGSIFEESFLGNHTLIREGAVLVRSARDILEDLRVYRKKSPPEKKSYKPELFLPSEEKKIAEPESSLSEEESIIWDSLENGTSLELLLSRTGLGTPRVLSLLTQLSLKGKVREEGGVYYRT